MIDNYIGARQIMHKKLFIPGPVEIHPDILVAMSSPMIGHRMKEYAELHARVTSGLKKLLFTEGRVFLATSSAFGVMEGAIRNLVGTRCANFCNGAFSDKWHDVTLRCGKQADAIRFCLEDGKIQARAINTALNAHINLKICSPDPDNIKASKARLPVVCSKITARILRRLSL